MKPEKRLAPGLYLARLPGLDTEYHANSKPVLGHYSKSFLAGNHKDAGHHMSKLRITKIEVHEFKFPMKDVAKDYNGFNIVYKNGSQGTGFAYVTRVYTNEGVTGEYVGGDSPSFAEFNMFANYLIGMDPTQRELIYNDVKRRYKHYLSDFKVGFVTVK